jgi:BNR repeat-like domain
MTITARAAPPLASRLVTRLPLRGALGSLVLLGLFLQLPAGSTAGGTGAVSVRAISKPSPFRRCPDGHGRVFVNGEVEPSLALDPMRRRVVVVYQQDRFADAAARGIAASFSADGGKTWKRSVLPVGFCALGRETQPFRTSDPWVSIGPDGRVYALASYAAVTSRNGGRTWGTPVALQRPASGFLLDKGSLTANPSRAGVAYAAWARYRLSASGPPDESDAMFARTTDGGRTWSAPKIILEHGRRAGPIASVVLPDPKRHRLYHLAFWQVGPEPRFDHPSKLVVQSSTNDGASWSAPHDIALGLTIGLGDDPSTGRKIRTGVVVPSFALDRRSGALYAVWQDSRFASRKVDQIVLSSSRDGGKTWTSPIRISHAGNQAFIPTVAVTGGGVLGLAYFEAPRGRSHRVAPVQYWLAFSRDGGRTFVRRRVGSSFSLRHAPLLEGVPELAVPPGLFLGDYMGMDASDGKFHLAFVTANSVNSNPTDVRYAVVATTR